MLAFALAASCGGPPPDADAEAGLTICAPGNTLEGVDVSKWDGTIDWAAVKGAGISFAIARVSDGLQFPDAYFDANWAAIKSQGMVRGSYQYFEPAQDPIAQANLVLQHIGTLGPGDLSPVIDTETMGGLSAGAVTSAIAQWISRINSATGRRPIIYTSPSFWSGLGNPAFAADLWVAHWGPICPSVPAPWTGWKLWQYSATGSVPGINGASDRDRFDGTLADLLAYAGGAADAGPDAGTPDAGHSDAGRPDPTLAAAAGGCSSSAPAWPWLAAGLALFARTRRRARDENVVRLGRWPS